MNRTVDRVPRICPLSPDIERFDRGHTRVDKHRRVTEQSGLIDGLWGANTMQLRGAIGSQNQHRNPRQIGLDNRRVEMRGCGSAGAQHGGRLTRRQSNAKSRKPSRAFVVKDLDAEFGSSDHRQGHWRAARPGSNNGVLEPTANPLIDKGCTEGGLHIVRPPSRHRPHDRGVSSRM